MKEENIKPVQSVTKSAGTLTRIFLILGTINKEICIWNICKEKKHT
jgi:hypothetical protein